jgi:hypothetical protein
MPVAGWSRCPSPRGAGGHRRVESMVVVGGSREPSSGGANGHRWGEPMLVARGSRWPSSGGVCAMPSPMSRGSKLLGWREEPGK